MSVKTYHQTMSEVEERVLSKNKYSMSVNANTQDQLESVSHNLNVTPFFDYQISYDGGKTFWPPSQFQTLDSLIYVQMFVSKTKLYFSYHYSSGSPANPALSIVFKYRLFITEAKK